MLHRRHLSTDDPADPKRMMIIRPKCRYSFSFATKCKMGGSACVDALYICFTLLYRQSTINSVLHLLRWFNCTEYKNAISLCACIKCLLTCYCCFDKWLIASYLKKSHCSYSITNHKVEIEHLVYWPGSSRVREMKMFCNFGMSKRSHIDFQ